MVVLSTAPSSAASATGSAVPGTGATQGVQVSEAPADRRPTTLWQLGIEAQGLTSRIAQLAEQLDSDAPDLQAAAIAELEATLLAEAGNREALEAKADATCWVIEHLRAQGAYRQQQAKRLSELGSKDGARADRLEASLLTVLTHLQPAATRFSLPHHELTSRRSQAVVIEAPELLDPEWLAVKTTAQPDKTAIKAALKAGRLIDGAQLVERRSWRIT
ncbi:MAG: siphovirus Gp157 family protein [Cyanobacteriota bacterium]|nr:siphovirus Gp157 family protein [Cyanobacteriota bacterium]